MRLTEYLQQHDLSDAEFADEIGVTRMQVWRYRNAVAIPKPGMMAKIAQRTRGHVTPNDWVPVPPAPPKQDAAA